MAGALDGLTKYGYKDTSMTGDRGHLWHVVRRALLAIAAAVPLLVAVTGCGSGSDSLVARVGDSAIGTRLLERWVRFEAVSAYETNAQKPAPAWVQPDPPDFGACVAHLRESVAASQPQPSVSQLRLRCRRRYEELTRQVVTILIHFRWVLGEGAEEGLNIPNSELMREFDRFKREAFKTDAAFRNYLTNTGVTASDELMRFKVDLITTRLREKALARAGSLQQRQLAYERFQQRLISKWTARTSCSARYIVEGCRQYRGPQKAL